MLSTRSVGKAKDGNWVGERNVSHRHTTMFTIYNFPITSPHISGGFFCLFFLKLWTLSGEAKDPPTRLTSHQPNLPQIDLIFEMGLCVSFGSSQSNTSEQKGSSFYFLLHWFVISPKALKVGKISCGFGKCWYFIMSYFVVYCFIIFLQVAWNTLSSWWQIANGIKLAQVHHRLELTICTGHDIYNTHTHTHFVFC